MTKSLRRLCASTALAVALLPVMASSPAVADTEQWGLNGTFRAQSNGEWAQTNDRYEDQRSVVATWTVSTTCSTRFDCEGQVRSDQGWSAPLYTKSGMFYVRHALPGWQRCPDGSVGDGLQVFHFYPATADGRGDMTSTSLFVGADVTTGVTGSCGVSKPVVIKLPFKLSQIGD